MSTPPPLPRRRPGWRTPILTLLVLVVLVVSLGAGGWWWINRPITPTVLTEGEQQALEQKMAALEPEAREAPSYVPGDKTIVLTERELNGFLGMHDLGEQLRLDLGKDALSAYVQARIPPDSPIFADKLIKGRARFLLTEEDGNPSVVLDDVTVWGISLPNAWLGNIKGQNLVEVAADELGNNFIADGIASLEVNRNEIVIHLAE